MGDYDADYYKRRYKEPAEKLGITVRALKAKLREGKCHTGNAEDRIEESAGGADEKASQTSAPLVAANASKPSRPQTTPSMPLGTGKI
jgi:hypothetical protein